MSTLDAKFIRWVQQSVYKHVENLKGTWLLFLEGEIRQTDKVPAWVELRMDGPYFFHLNKNYWRAYIEVNALVSLVTHTDLYGLARISGEVNSILSRPILAKEYEDGEELIGCFQTLDDIREGSRVSNFGQIDPKNKLQQATVEVHYEMFFTKE